MFHVSKSTSHDTTPYGTAHHISQNKTWYINGPTHGAVASCDVIWYIEEQYYEICNMEHTLVTAVGNILSDNRIKRK